MKHTQFPPISDVSLASLTSDRKSNSARGYFALFMGALHASRRLQAARSIRQYRHLFHEEHRQDAGKKAQPQSLMDEAPRTVLETRPRAGTPGAAMSFNAKLLIAIAIAGFGILHAIADGALRHAPSPPPTEDGMPLANRD
jgi:hypothetical protein